MGLMRTGLTAIGLTGERYIDQQRVAAYLGGECLAKHFAESALRSSSDLLQELMTYWHGLQVGHALPGRQHFRPEEIRHLLPYIVLYEVVTPANDSAAYRFRTRLIGTHFVEMWGREISGLYLDEVTDPADYAAWRPQLVAVAQQRRPVFGIASVPTPSRDFIRYAHLTLPLAADGENVDMLLGARVNLTALTSQNTDMLQGFSCREVAIC